MNEKDFQDDSFTAGETKLITIDFIRLDRTPIALSSTFTPTLKVCYSEDKSYMLLQRQGIVLENEIGVVEFVLNADDTENWEDGSYIFQVEVSSISGDVIIGEGEWFIGGGM